jgi:UDP-glucose 4-epimerase
MRTGQSTHKTVHLISRACQAAANDIDELEIYGEDYPTPDGTCIRDYIHVQDIASAHRLALQKNFDEKCRVFNCGYGHGYSVREIVDTFKKVTKIDFPVKVSPRRAGDLTQLAADSSALRETLDWKPEFDDVNAIIQTAWGWYQRERLKK